MIIYETGDIYFDKRETIFPMNVDIQYKAVKILLMRSFQLGYVGILDQCSVGSYFSAVCYQ